MDRTTARRAGLTGALLTGALLTGALVLTGCADNSVHGAMSDMSDSPAANSSAAGSDAAAQFNDADVEFATNMRPHHEQAIAMARMAADQATDPRVQDLAARIEAAQGPEIDTLSGWIDAWGAEDSSSGDGGMDHGSTGHGRMGGMMSDEDMETLANTSGAQFDVMWLDLMRTHHEGAVKMAETEIAEGSNPAAIAMAEKIRDTQNAEIAEIRELLAELDG